MEDFLVWKILEIEETKDENLIKDAYRVKLKTVNPEDDQAGFMQLREAYEKALYLAKKTDEPATSVEDEFEALKDGSEVDQFIYRMNILYRDLETRCDEDEWDALLCSYEDDLDGELQERVLVYIMGHHLFPWAIWKKLDAKFQFVAETDILKEKFPENFLGYVNYYITHDAFIEFDLFEGELDQDVDGYINRYLDVKGTIERLEGEVPEQTISEIMHTFEYLEECDVYHPYIDAEKLHFYLELKERNKKSIPEHALQLADRLSSEYAESFYVDFYAGMTFIEFDKGDLAKQIFIDLLGQDGENYLARYGMVKAMIATKEYVEAKEKCLDLLDAEERNADLNDLLETINEFLVPIYEKKRKENPEDADNLVELGWCYFQQQKYELVKEVMTAVPKENYKEYDFYNLTGRNYLAMDQYETALPFLLRWREMIGETVDDGSRESQKRFNRKGFSYFSVGISHWYLGEKELAYTEIDKGIEYEKARQYQMSYRDQKAVFYIKDGKYAEAIDICNSLIEEDEGYYHAYLRRQEAYFELKNGQKVIDDFYNCKRIYASFVRPYIFAMRVFYYARQYSDALNIYKQAKDLNLESDELDLYYYKVLRANKKDNEELRALLPKVCDYANNCFAKKIYDKESQAESEAANEHPELYTDLESFEQVYIENALYYLELDEITSFNEIIEKGLKMYPDSFSIKQLKGEVLWEHDEVDEAYDCLSEIVKKGHKDIQAFMILGKICKDRATKNVKDLDSLKESISYFSRCYEENNRSQETLYYLIRMYRMYYRRIADSNKRKELYDKAFYFSKELYDIEQSAFNAIELGLTYDMVHSYDEALKYYDIAISLENNNIYAHNNKANIYITQGKYELAKKELQIAEKLENDNEPTMVYELLVDLYKGLKDYKEAIRYALIQLKRYPKDKALLFELLNFYEQTGSYEDAIRTCEKLYQYAFLEKYELCYYSAKYYYLDGKKMKAMKLYHEALSLTSNNPEAKKRVIESKKNWR